MGTDSNNKYFFSLIINFDDQCTSNNIEIALSKRVDFVRLDIQLTYVQNIWYLVEFCIDLCTKRFYD